MMVNFLINLPHPYFLQIIHCLIIMEGLVPLRVGGLAISVINLSIIHPFQCPFIQHVNVLVLLFHYPPFQLKFYNLYRLSSSSISAFCTEFETLLEHHITSNVDLIFVSYFNIHIGKQDDLNTVLFN